MADDEKTEPGSTSPPEDGSPNPFDVSMKTLCRHAPAILLRLAGAHVDPEILEFDDPVIVLPEHRADQVLLVGARDDPDRFGVQFEYQAQPDPEVLIDWQFKNSALQKQLRIPVLLIALYLQKGDRATFPAVYGFERAGLEQQFRFNAVRLWEEAERIRSGELAELAPLLVLYEPEPTEATIRDEIGRIRALEAEPRVRAGLMSVAYTLGHRYFSRAVLDVLFREEVAMIKDLGIFGDWIEEARAKGQAEGQAEGQATGQAEEARRFALKVLGSRFGPLPPETVMKIEQADAEWCEAFVEQALRSERLPDPDAGLS